MTEGFKKELFVPVCAALNKVASTLEICTGSMNIIMQFAESYLLKGGSIQAQMRAYDLADIQTFADNLKNVAHLESEDVARIVVAWLEQRTQARRISGAGVSSVTKSILESVRMTLSEAGIAALTPPEGN